MDTSTKQKKRAVDKTAIPVEFSHEYKTIKDFHEYTETDDKVILSRYL